MTVALQKQNFDSAADGSGDSPVRNGLISRGVSSPVIHGVRERVRRFSLPVEPQYRGVRCPRIQFVYPPSGMPVSQRRRIEGLSVQNTFDMKRQAGRIVLSHTVCGVTAFSNALAIAETVLAAGLGAGRRLIAWEIQSPPTGEASSTESIGIGALSEINLDGILAASGVPATPRYSGLLEMSEGAPFRFVQLVDLDTTTRDPVELFINGGMTGVSSVVRTGNGFVGATLREIPAPAVSRAFPVLSELERMGMITVLAKGAPGRSVLDLPISAGNVGLVLSHGLNPMAAMIEQGLRSLPRSMSALCDFSDLYPAC